MLVWVSVRVSVSVRVRVRDNIGKVQAFADRSDFLLPLVLGLVSVRVS